MITPAYAGTMARYNRWQNESLYREALKLSDEERQRDRGAFFGSIHGTLNHLFWGDSLWLSRFGGGEKPRTASVASAWVSALSMLRKTCAHWATTSSAMVIVA